MQRRLPAKLSQNLPHMSSLSSDLWLPQIVYKLTFCRRIKPPFTWRSYFSLPQILIFHRVCGHQKSNWKLDIGGRLREGSVTKGPLFPVRVFHIIYLIWIQNLPVYSCDLAIWKNDWNFNLLQAPWPLTKKIQQILYTICFKNALFHWPNIPARRIIFKSKIDQVLFT